MAEEWNLAGVLDEISKIDRTMNDRSFAFVLGAGASFTSGIPTGEHLAKGWLEELYIRECKNGSELVGWVNSDALGIEGLIYTPVVIGYGGNDGSLMTFLGRLNLAYPVITHTH